VCGPPGDVPGVEPHRDQGHDLALALGQGRAALPSRDRRWLGLAPHDRDEDREPAAVDVSQPRREVDGDLAAVRAHEIARPGVFARLQELLPLAIGTVELGRLDAVAERAADQLAAGGAEQLGGRRVEVDDAALFVEQRDRVRSAIEDESEQPLPTRPPTRVAHPLSIT
jgi:hypothetical protein